MKDEDNLKHDDQFDDNCYEQADMLGVPRSEHKADKTSMKGRYVDIPVEHFGYPSDYDKRLEIRRGNYEESEAAAVIENNDQV